MSELIDSIFDVEKISGEVKAVLAELTKITSSLNTYKDAVAALETTTRKSKGTEDLINNSKSLNDLVVKGGVEMKRYEVEVSNLKAKTEQLTGAEKAAAIEIAKARLELQAAQKATKEAAIAEIEKTAAVKDMSGSYNSLVLQLKVAQKEYKAMSAEEANSAKGKELLAKIQSTQKALKDSDASMGNYQRNVGNYASALEGMTPRIGGIAGTILYFQKADKKTKYKKTAGGG
jgi:chromosome segregation ATPase